MRWGLAIVLKGSHRGQGRSAMNKLAIMALSTIALSSPALAEPGDAARGQQDFRACAPCHSLEPDRNLTGPSLSGLWGRKAGSLASFSRYSDALGKSGIVWDEKTLDAWVRNPEALVPRNLMLFEGIRDDRARTDLIAFLKAASRPGSPLAGKPRPLPNLRDAPPGARVSAIRHCKDTYYVSSAAGDTVPDRKS